MIRKLIYIVILGLPTTLFAFGNTYDLDRSGSFYISPRIALTFPAGALADGNYHRIAACWRQEGLTASGELGYYMSNSTVAGLEVAYSNFPPKQLAEIEKPELDRSRVRIRRCAIFLKYQMVPLGSFRPFFKLAFGFFEVNLINLPQPDTDPLEYNEYSLSAKPAFSGGVGFTWYLSGTFSAEFSVEAVSLNSFSSAWEGSGTTSTPLRKNLLFFPVYFALSYHMGGSRR